MEPITRHSLTIAAAVCIVLIGGEGGLAKPAVGEQVSVMLRERSSLPPASSGPPAASPSRGTRVAEVAPNGDVFVADSKLDAVEVLHLPAGGSGAAQHQVFARGLRQPFGIAFYPAGADPRWVYIAARDGVVRYAYKNGDLKASGNPELIVSGIPTTHYARGAAADPRHCEGMTVQPSTGEIWCIAGGRDEPGDGSPLDLEPM
jgi:glucose/arabinose dehydrogenase